MSIHVNLHKNLSQNKPKTPLWTHFIMRIQKIWSKYMEKFFERVKVVSYYFKF